MGRTPVFLLTALLALIVLMAGCTSRPHVVVGSKNFTEQLLIGEIAAAQIESRLGIQVDRKLNLGGTLLAHEALRSGAIDLFPEYTGTALTAVLKQPIVKDPAAALQAVREGYRAWNLEWLPPLGFNNSFAMVVRSEIAREQHLANLSEAAKRAAPWRLGVGYEFTARPDGLKGLVREYGLRLAGDPAAMDLGLLYPALLGNRIEMAAASATDGMLANPGFTILDDDRHYFPPYQCALIVRDDTLARIPGLRAALSELSGRISDAQMRRMNADVDVDHKTPAEVARNFLNHRQ
jgi:osmoprotectant transport system substrate-binding protein